MTRSETFQRKNLYKDFDLNFTLNPLTDDISIKKDENAIKQSIKSLISTNYYERPFNPELGSSIRELLFELADPIIITELRSAITDTIKNYEPRAEIVKIYIEDMSDKNAYNIRIYFKPVMREDVTEFNFILERLR